MNLAEQGWQLLEEEDQLIDLYPRPKYGQYRPQPYYEPENYPCWFKEIAIVDNTNGPDHAILAYVYTKEENK